MNTVGTSCPRVDGAAKVSGRALYTVDYAAAGMLHGAVLRSPVPAGRVVSLDVARAVVMPGVRAVVTAAQASGRRVGWAVRDEPLFASDRVRYEGEPIAAVAADTPAQARAALGVMTLVIEETEPVADLDCALAGAAALVHPDLEQYELGAMAAMAGGLERRGNMVGRTLADSGGVDEAFARAAHVVEDEFIADRQYQGYLEPRAAVATYEAGRYTIHAGSQFPFNVRDETAEFLGVRPSSVRVVGHSIGGGFGGKLDFGIAPYAALLAKAAGGRPVKVVLGRGEDLLTAGCRENARITVRSALDREGNVLARDIVCDLDCGAYARETPMLTSIPLLFGSGAYRVGAIRVQARAVYTNTAPTGAFRGVSGTWLYMAIERHIDHIAQVLGEDRRAYRLRHLLRDGDCLPNGQRLDDAGVLAKAFAAVEDVAPWERLTNAKPACRGVGIAAAVWITNPLPGAVDLKVNTDGTVSVVTGANDNGSGAVSMGVTQIVAEEIGVPPGDVIVAFPDTDTCGFDAGSQGSRTTHIVGRAAQFAAAEVREKIFAVAAKMLECDPADLELAQGAVGVKGAPAARVPLATVAMAATFQGLNLAGTGSYATPPVPFNPGCAQGLLFPTVPTPTYHVHLAEVEVDPDTGNVRVLRYVVAQEVGRAINPGGVAGQIQGGVAQGLGYALYEGLRLREGRYLERTLEAYRLPVAVDVPRVESIVLEHPDALGPYGAKGVAEGPIVPVAAAVANAVSDAIGRPLNRIPITPADVLEALVNEGT